MLTATGSSTQQQTALPVTQQTQLEQYAFISWLCNQETKVVGHGGSRFGSPLVEWLSFLVGYQCTVEDTSYGWVPLGGQWCWRALPAWGIRFQRKMDGYTIRPLIGSEALDILASLEMEVSPLKAVA
jgi:hypothetical protein